MSWMITQKQQLHGTLYVEVLPGPYLNECWNDASVYFEEDVFTHFEPTVAKHFPDFDHYAFCEIPADAWKRVIADLDGLGNAIRSGATVVDLSDRLGFLYETSLDRFLVDERGNLKKLHRTIQEFTAWLTSQLKVHHVVSVLGV